MTDRAELWKFCEAPIAYIEAVCAQINLNPYIVAREAGIDDSTWFRWHKSGVVPGMDKLSDFMGVLRWRVQHASRKQRRSHAQTKRKSAAQST